MQEKRPYLHLFRPFLLRWGSAAIVLLFAPLALGQGACPPHGYDRAALSELKSARFEIGDDAERARLSIALLACLGDPDPALRDGIVYEGLATWLRGNKLDEATRRKLLLELSALVHPSAVDAAGFRQAFAALVLSEVARTDRIAAWLTPDERATLVESAARYLESIRDYRGFDAEAGWRHGVAHGADVLMQLTLNPALDKAQLDRVLAAVASQVAPPGEHAYVEGESERLARPVVFAALRGLHSQSEWQAWFQGIVAPAPLKQWSEAYSSRAGLAKHHNVTAFLRASYVGAREGNDERLEVLVPGLQAALKIP